MVTSYHEFDAVKFRSRSATTGDGTASVPSGYHDVLTFSER